MSAISDDQPEDYRRSSKCRIGDCVEVGRRTDGKVVLRSTRAVHSSQVVIDPDEWDSFVLGVKNGDFDTV